MQFNPLWTFGGNTMKRILLLTAIMALVATSAFAVGGIDLSTVACPGNAGSIGTLGVPDCVNGIVVLGTWSPAEAIADLTALDGSMTGTVAGGRAANGFWDFDAQTGCNAAGLNSSQARPAGCTSPAYTATWSPAGSGTAIAGIGQTANQEGLGFTVFRPSILSVAADQNLFGLQVTIAPDNAVENGGACSGCTNAGFTLSWDEGLPRSASGALAAPTPLHGPTGHFPGFDNSMSFNGGAVATKKSSWGQLKSLYR